MQKSDLLLLLIAQNNFNLFSNFKQRKKEKERERDKYFSRNKSYNPNQFIEIAFFMSKVQSKSLQQQQQQLDLQKIRKLHLTHFGVTTKVRTTSSGKMDFKVQAHLLCRFWPTKWAHLCF